MDLMIEDHDLYCEWNSVASINGFSRKYRIPMVEIFKIDVS
jgi:Mor family transcriptional regulator